MIGALDLEAQAGREVFLVADHHIHVPGDFPVHGLRLFEAADGFPQGGAIIQIVADDDAMLFGGGDGLEGQGGGGFRQRGKNAAGVQPARADFSEDMIPVEVTRLELRRRGMAAIRDAHRAAQAEAALGEVQTVADAAADAIVRAPNDEIRVHAALHDEVLDQMADLVVHQGGADGGFIAETLAQTARGVVFAAAFPGAEPPRRADAALAGVQAQHDFAKRNLVVMTLRPFAD